MYTKTQDRFQMYTFFGRKALKNLQKAAPEALLLRCLVLRMDIYTPDKEVSLKSRAYLFSQNSARFFHVYNFTLYAEFVYMAWTQWRTGVQSMRRPACYIHE